jgi:hypothetical protein
MSPAPLRDVPTGSWPSQRKYKRYNNYRKKDLQRHLGQRARLVEPSPPPAPLIAPSMNAFRRNKLVFTIGHRPDVGDACGPESPSAPGSAIRGHAVLRTLSRTRFARLVPSESEFGRREMCNTVLTQAETEERANVAEEPAPEKSRKRCQSNPGRKPDMPRESCICGHEPRIEKRQAMARPANSAAIYVPPQKRPGGIARL